VSKITKEQLDAYKNLFPEDKRLQTVSLEELLKNTGGGNVDWKTLAVAAKGGTEAPEAVSISACDLAIGWVIVDVICLALGAVEVRAGLSARTAEDVAEAAGPVLSKLETIIQEMSAAGASKTTIAKGVFKILGAIYNAGLLGAVVKAFVSNLSWYYAVLYGATAVATIVAILATDGAAFVAEVVLELATFGFLVADSVGAVKACGWS